MDPDCKKPWSDDFLGEFSVKAWLNGAYKKHRGQILMDIEKARLPETQEDARRYKEAVKYISGINEKIKVLKKRIEELPETAHYEQLKKEVETARQAWYAKYHVDRTKFGNSSPEWKAFQAAALKKDAYQITKYKTAVAKYKQKIKEYRDAPEYRNNLLLMERFGTPLPERAVAGAGSSTVPKEEPKKNWSFTMKCPITECQGFVDMAYKCGMCEAKICKECHEVNDTATHVCDPEKVLSVKAIAKEAKPCPQCAALISKVDGCDQMWCTQCHVAFSWRTGAIETHVHNPHYFEWMRRNGRVPQPMVAGAACAITPRDIVNTAMTLAHCREHNAILNWIQCIGHNLWHTLNRYSQELRWAERNSDEKKHRYRVERLVCEITDEKWMQLLSTEEKTRMKCKVAADIYDMFVNASTDILREALDAANDKDSVVKQLESLAAYTNEQISAARTRFKDYSLPQIHPLPATT